jgi:hypothetical protein
VANVVAAVFRFAVLRAWIFRPSARAGAGAGAGAGGGAVEVSR